MLKPIPFSSCCSWTCMSGRALGPKSVYRESIGRINNRGKMVRSEHGVTSFCNRALCCLEPDVTGDVIVSKSLCCCRGNTPLPHVHTVSSRFAWVWCYSRAIQVFDQVDMIINDWNSWMTVYSQFGIVEFCVLLLFLPYCDIIMTSLTGYRPMSWNVWKAVFLQESTISFALKDKWIIKHNSFVFKDKLIVFIDRWQLFVFKDYPCLQRQKVSFCKNGFL